MKEPHGWPLRVADLVYNFVMKQTENKEYVASLSGSLLLERMVKLKDGK